jgi:CheY-like chemotaxis protein
MSLCILVVDDNRELADNLAEALTAEDHRAFVVYTGEEALLAVEALRFDIVLADIRMPGMNGVELVFRLSERDPHATYLLMTAYSSDALVNEARASVRVRAVLAKQRVLEELLPWVLNVAGGAAPTGGHE